MLSRSLALSLILPLCLASEPVRAKTGPHHIVVIVLDCVGIEALSQYQVGQQMVFADTPAIDRIIAEGVQFQNAWAMPTCSPTRASVLLGEYPFRHGIGRQISPGGMSLSASAANTLPGLLKTASPSGYATGAFGKWHLSGNPTLLTNDPAAPQNLGFDHFEGEMFHVPGLYVDPMDGTSQWQKYIWDGTSVSQEGSDGVNYLIEQQTQDAIDFFNASQLSNANQPVFLWLALQAPFEIHQRPPADHAQQGLQFPGGTQSGKRARTQSDKYPCFVESLHAADQEIGRLLDEIEVTTSQPWYDTTTVMLFGDNGTPGDVVQVPFSTDHAKNSLFEGGVRVPLYVSGRVVDSSRKGLKETSLVQVIDVWPSCLEIAAVAAPTGYPGDAFSLLPLVDSPTPTPMRTFIYSEMFATNIPQSQLPHVSGDRRIAKMIDTDGEWKLFHTPSSAGGGQSLNDVLYELPSSLWETTPPLIPTQVGDQNASLYAAKASTLRGFIQQLYAQ